MYFNYQFIILGGFLFPLFYSKYVEYAGWRNTLRALSAGMLVGCIAGYAYIPLVAEKKKEDIENIEIRNVT